jgi:hypothetical protein
MISVGFRLSMTLFDAVSYCVGCESAFAATGCPQNPRRPSDLPWTPSDIRPTSPPMAVAYPGLDAVECRAVGRALD